MVDKFDDMNEQKFFNLWSQILYSLKGKNSIQYTYQIVSSYLFCLDVRRSPT